MSAPKQIVLPSGPFEGGSRNMMVAAIVGVIGIVLWFVSMSFATPERALYSWLWSFFRPHAASLGRA